MKKITSYLLIVMAPAIIVSCNNGDNNDEKTIAPATDTTNTTVADNTNAPKDSNTAMLPGPKDTLPLKVVKGKNGKLAKIVVVLPKINSKAAMDMDKEGYYSNVEVWPSYPGGQQALEDFFARNVEYPQTAADNGTEGTVNISFLVDEAGKVSSPKIISKPIGDGLEDEAMRVFNKMPTWSPGKIKGKNVKTRFTLPVKFQLES
ncbi:energy transducer TonB [Ferruginibacter sp.]